ncbi:ParB/RepB/Spo0J family partition protein [Thioclava kandeliae]|uniref:ParB N-terminal domain-containing protein n=1 Tax=Thioclava kandeliae TaxID=3070818 RepID=A0ABV1SNB7_9RHOB
MAKRKRLTPANPGFLQNAPEDSSSPTAAAESGPQNLEPISASPMVRTVSHRPPIASVAAEAADRAALEDMTAMIAELRASGRMVEMLPLDQVEASHLIRDRLVTGDASEEMDVLVSSIRARGQQSPVEVLDRGAQANPRYGLISGWRRLAALRQLANEGHGTNTVLAVIRHPNSSADAYVAMVEENEIRADISFYERARIVVKSLEAGVFENPKEALNTLFGNVSRAKRSKIKSFMMIVEALDGYLRFPAALSERTGLNLVKRLEADPDLGAFLSKRLAATPASDAETEARYLAASPRPTLLSRPEVSSTRRNFELVLDKEAQELRIAGPDVDEALFSDLQRWLARR